MGGWKLAAIAGAVSLAACGCGGGGSGDALPVGVAAPPVAVQIDYGPIIDRLTAGGPAWQTLSAQRLTGQVSLPPDAVADDVDGRELLRLLFARVTQGQTTDEGKVIAWLTYVQNRIAHPRFNPKFTDGAHITEPLWVLENQIGKCGATNRVLVDGLLAAGYQARIAIILKDASEGHQVAEVFLDGGWRYLDADWLGNGEVVRKADGSLASVAEIQADRSLLDGLNPNAEMDAMLARGINVRWGNSTLAEMFNVIDSYIYKAATPEQEQSYRFGWEFIRYER
jgi:hypothetical protein